MFMLLCCVTKVKKRKRARIRDTTAIVLELKRQPRGENGALSAPINLIRIPDMRAAGQTFLHAMLTVVLQDWESKGGGGGSTCYAKYSTQLHHVPSMITVRTTFMFWLTLGGLFGNQVLRMLVCVLGTHGNYFYMNDSRAIIKFKLMQPVVKMQTPHSLQSY